MPYRSILSQTEVVNVSESLCCLRIVEFQEEVLSFMVSLKDGLKSLSSDVQHMHYLIRTGSKSRVELSESGELLTRITEMIPCTSYVELSSSSFSVSSCFSFCFCLPDLLV